MSCTAPLLVDPSLSWLLKGRNGDRIGAPRGSGGRAKRGRAQVEGDTGSQKQTREKAGSSPETTATEKVTPAVSQNPLI